LRSRQDPLAQSSFVGGYTQAAEDGNPSEPNISSSLDIDGQV
jgi:hypothetical protein